MQKQGVYPNKQGIFLHWSEQSSPLFLHSIYKWPADTTPKVRCLNTVALARAKWSMVLVLNVQTACWHTGCCNDLAKMLARKLKNNNIISSSTLKQRRFLYLHIILPLTRWSMQADSPWIFFRKAAFYEGIHHLRIICRKKKKREAMGLGNSALLLSTAAQKQRGQGEHFPDFDKQNTSKSLFPFFFS